MPMPSASVSTASTVNAGDLQSWRSAKRMSFNMEVIQPSGSFGSQRDDRIHTCRAAGWHAAGNQRDYQKRKHGDQYGPRIDDADVVKQGHQRPASSDCTDQADCYANYHQ